MSGEAAVQEQPQSNLPVQVQRSGDLGLGAVGGERAPNRIFTRKERAVLECITSAECRDMTNEERARRVGVSLRHYYQIMADPWFRQQHRQFIQAHVQARVKDLVEASVVTAATPGRDGFNDRRMMFEMTGHYVPRQQIDHTTAGQPIVGVVGVDPGQL